MLNTVASRLAQTLEWREAGDGSPLLLVHGIQGTADAWGPLLPALADFRCVLPNLPGRGLSPRWQAGGSLSHARYYHLDHYADLVQALLVSQRERHGERVTLAGWSMGVSVILSLLRRHGDDGVGRLIFISGTACATPEAVWFRSETPQALEEEARARAERLGLMAVADADAVAASWASVREADLREAARSIRRPTLVVHGELDDECPLDHGRWLADHVPGAHWLPLPGVGHAALGQATVSIGSSMSDFMKS